jgi:hypothetical protein
MWRPEIARRWARFEARSASSVPASMAERSPVVIAAAKAPARPGTPSITAAVIAMRVR